MDSSSSFKFTSSHVELSSPLDAILDEIPSHDKTLTIAKRIKEKQPNNKLSTANQSMAKKTLRKRPRTTFRFLEQLFDTGFPSRLPPSFSPYPTHLALPFSVPMSPCTVSLLYEDDWGRVRFGDVVFLKFTRFSHVLSDIMLCTQTFNLASKMADVQIVLVRRFLPLQSG